MIASWSAQLPRPEQVLKDLAKLAGGKILTLLCFEPPPPGVEVRELGHEQDGGGRMHPKLPNELCASVGR